MDLQHFMLAVSKQLITVHTLPTVH